MAKRLGVVVFLVCIIKLFAFNLDLEVPQIYGGKAHEGEWFGYSVALDLLVTGGRRLVAISL